MFERLREWIRAWLGIRAEAPELPLEQFVRAYEDITEDNITATVANKLAMLTIADSTLELTDPAGREAMTPRAQLIAEAMTGLWREDITWIVAQAYGKGGVVLAPRVTQGRRLHVDVADQSRVMVLEKDGEPVTLRIITYGSHGALLPTFAEAMQDALKELGIQTDISLNDYSVHTDLLSSGDFDIALNSYIMAPAIDPQYFADILFRTGANYNYGKYSNADVDALVDQLDSEFDPARRVELAIEIQNLIVEDCPWLCLGHLAFQVVGNAKVSGYETQATELYLLTKDTDIAE